MPASTIHIEPSPTGRWAVRRGDEREARSEHDSATDAERAARALAEVDGVALVLHDRYSRTPRLRTRGPD
jgi:hypothetical protein